MTEGTRPPADGATLRAVTTALASARSAARADADVLLTHVPDVGDLATQRLLDAWVEQAADTLRALSEALEERLLDVGVTGGGTALEREPAPDARWGR